MSLLLPERVLTNHKQLRKLPTGAVVANGPSDVQHFVFAKVSQDEAGGYWKWYDIKIDDFHKQNAFRHLHPDYVSEKGFRQLNLPVYLLTKTGDREELTKHYAKFLREVRLYQ